MKKTLYVLIAIFICGFINAAVPAAVSPTPSALPAAVQTAVPDPAATPKLSAIEMYRQMTGKKAEREFPTATAVVTAVDQVLYKPAPQGMTSTGWFIIAADAALTGWAIFSTVDFNNSVDAYERLKTQLDVPPYSNYDFLIREQEKANSKLTTAVIAWSLSGVCLAYTAADLLWFHSAFPAQLRSAYDPATGAVTVFVNSRF